MKVKRPALSADPSSMKPARRDGKLTQSEEQTRRQDAPTSDRRLKLVPVPSPRLEETKAQSFSLWTGFLMGLGFAAWAGWRVSPEAPSELLPGHPLASGQTFRPDGDAAPTPPLPKKAARNPQRAPASIAAKERREDEK